MNLRINGTSLQAEATTLAALLIELDYDDAAVATAVNGGFVRRVDRATIVLAEDDAVEILTPRQGG